LAGTRAGTPGDEVFDKGGRTRFVRTREAHQIENEIRDVVGHWHLAHGFLQFHDLGATEHRLDVDLKGAGGAGHNLTFFLAARVFHFHQEDEPVALRLGQWIGAFLLDGVLRG
jgi:hypothetical protein